MHASTRPTRLAWSLAALLLAACGAPTPGTPQQPVLDRAQVNGYTMEYQRQGSGEPVLMVHGAVADHRAWDFAREAVARRYLFIAPTQRYFGTAPWPDKGERFSVAQHADDLAVFIRQLGLGPVHTVGWSYGGTVQFELAARHPDLVKSIVSFEPFVPNLVADGKTFGDHAGAMFGPVVEATKANGADAALPLFMDQVNEAPGSFTSLPTAVRSMMADNSRTMPLQFADPPSKATCAQLSRFNRPVTVLLGELSGPVWKMSADAVTRCLPGAKVVTLANGRHLMPAQQPAAFTAALLDSLGRR